MKFIAIVPVIALLTSCAFSQYGVAPELPPLQTVARIDLNRYLGLWYEIGRYPNSFQKGCLGSSAMYTARPDGEIDILNSCRDEQEGSLREAKGRAWVVDNASNARLKVSFFWIKLYLLTIPVFFAIDMIWLGYAARNFYKTQLHHLLSPEVNWPAAFLLFFRNHGLLDLWNRPAWRTVAGGSNSYVKAFTASFTGTFHLNTKIRRIFRNDGGVQVQFADQHHETFDQVVLATHADQTLRLLGDPTPEETRLLGPWQYEENHTVLHTDLSVLPSMRRAWSCWNFCREGSGSTPQPAYVTYAMNLLQGLTTSKQYLVTLNRLP